MFLFVLIGAALAIGVGVTIKLVTDHLAAGDTSGAMRINGHELVVGSVVSSLVLIPAVVGIGFSISKSSAMTYKEFYNGLESSAVVDKTTCTRDGSCRHTYQCDPYLVTVTKTRTVSDGKGGTTTETYLDTETRYHSCPYVKYELNHYVTDTLGDRHHIGGTRFPVNANKHRWRGNTRLPNVAEGAPALWTAAKARVDAGNPGGVTKMAKYDNYIQASQHDVYAKHSDAIGDYLKDGLLPKPATEVYDYYQARKFHPVKLKTTIQGAWDEALARFNGRLGGERRGDLHVVAVDAAQVNAPDQYALALEAYWQSPDLGKNTLSKNGIAVVLGVEKDTVVWARAFTGMPAGNEQFAVNVSSSLPGALFTPAGIFGASGLGQEVFDALIPPSPATTEKAGLDKVAELGKTVTGQAPAVEPNADTTTRTFASLDAVVFADVGGYERIRMADYEYLKDDIQASTAAKVWVTVIGLVMSLGIWGLMLAIEFTIPLPAGWSRGKSDD